MSIEQGATKKVWVASNLIVGGPWTSVMANNLTKEPSIQYKYFCPKFSDNSDLCKNIVITIKEFLEKYKIPVKKLISNIEFFNLCKFVRR